MLHGCDQSATEFAQGTRMNQLAGRAGCAVLYPQQLRGTQARRCWRWFDRATLQGGGDAAAIMAVLRQVQERHRIDPARIYLAGLSAGAALAHIVALNHPRTFAALGLHSGPLFGAGHGALGALGVMRHGSALRVEPAIAEVVRRQGAFPALPAILIQGTHDPVVRPVNQEQLLRQLMLVNGLPDAARTTVAHKVGQGVAYAVRDVYAGRKVRLRVVTIDQLGHAWSGGDARLPFHSSGGPEASRMMLQFFRRHRRLPG
jgi:poly(hydroxyalkanoate) depolymerase family esterase